MKKLLFILFSLLVALQCGTGKQDRLRTGDLIFVGVPLDYSVTDSTMDSAIASATAVDDTSTTLIHVAIAEVTKDSVWVIDATIKHGVDRHPLDTFLKDFTLKDGTYPEFKVMRLKGIDGKVAVERAKTYCGRQYDVRYLPDNEDLYCSELVQYCFLDKEGDRILNSAPMNFLAPDGTMPPYWTWLFGELGMEVPQAVLGTNPENMSKSDMLEEVHVNILDYTK